jgi:multidrug efflux pump
MRKLVGVTAYFQSMQDVKVGGRSSAGTYQYTLQSNDEALLHHWLPLSKTG